MAELAKAIDQDETVTDLRDLFARHAQQSQPAESTWFVAEPEPVEAAEVTDDLVRFGVETLGARVSILSVISTVMLTHLSDTTPPLVLAIATSVAHY
jgi:hypothetical protein